MVDSPKSLEYANYTINKYTEIGVDLEGRLK